MKLVFSVLWRASERWQRVRFTDIERRHLDRHIEMKRKRSKEGGPRAPISLAPPEPRNIVNRAEFPRGLRSGRVCSANGFAWGEMSVLTSRHIKKATLNRV
ncbi:MAG: hypothetical protein H5T74_00230 [Actinobacteria bacterium]|nr:hypothetical protein [Actinomycetota bacterium]